jgi:hypothetical protein
MPGDACADCGSKGADHYLGEVLLCDRCFNSRVAELTGYPDLPEAPPPLTLTDTEGRQHRLRFRVWRAPTGIEVELEELGVPVGEGYRFVVLGAHDADVAELIAAVRSRANDEMSRRFLQPNPHRAGYVVAEDTDRVEGRLIWSDEGSEVGTPYNVIIDGKTLTWEELGRALEPYEGWRVRIELVDSIDDLRPDATIVSLGRPPDKPSGPSLDPPQ